MTTSIDEALQKRIRRITIDIRIHRRWLLVSQVCRGRAIEVDVDVGAVEILVLAYGKQVVHGPALVTLDVVEVDKLGVWMTRRAFVFGGAWMGHAAVVVGAVDGGVTGAVEGVGGVYLRIQ